MEELSLFKLKQRTELINITRYLTINKTDWVNNKATKYIDMQGYNLVSTVAKIIVGPRYYSDTTTRDNNYTLEQLSNCQITVNAREIINERLQIDFIAQNTPDFPIEVVVQFTGYDDENETDDLSSVISTFPIGGGSSGVTGIKVGNEVATGEVEFQGVTKSGNIITVSSGGNITYNKISNDGINYPLYAGINNNVLKYSENIYITKNPNNSTDYLITTGLNDLELSSSYQENNNSTHFKKETRQTSATIDFPRKYRQDIQFGNRSFFIGIRNPIKESSDPNAFLYSTKTLGINFRPYKTNDSDSASQLTLLGHKIKLNCEKILIDNDNEFKSRDGKEHREISANAFTLRIGKLILNGDRIEDVIASFITNYGTQGTCIIGYENQPYSQFFNYTVKTKNEGGQTLSVEDRAASFAEALNSALQAKGEGANASYLYNEIIIMPNTYYLTGQTINIDRNQFSIRGINTSTKIVCSETDFSNNTEYSMFNITGGNVTIENIGLGYYLSKETRADVNAEPSSTKPSIIYNNTSCLLRINGRNFIGNNITFSHSVLDSDLAHLNTIRNSDDEQGGFKIFDTGLGMILNKETDTDKYPQSNAYINRTDNDKQNRAYMIKQTIYIDIEKDELDEQGNPKKDTQINAGIFECFWDEQFAKYTIFRNYPTDCISTVIGCRCMINKPWYSMNVPVTGCTAYDSNVETTSTNTDGWENPGVFETSKHNSQS